MACLRNKRNSVFDRDCTKPVYSLETVAQTCSVKKLFLEISQNS